MKNRYPKACSICQGTVPAGEGIVRGSRATGWVVTHAEACPRNSVRHGYARAHLRGIMVVLNRTSVTNREVDDAVGSLAELVRTRWTSPKGFEKVILSSRAFSGMDRLEVEEIIQRFLPESSHC